MFGEKLSGKLDEYENHFGDSFPTVPLALSRTEAEVIEMINTCIANDKDVYDMGYLDPDSDDEY